MSNRPRRRPQLTVKRSVLLGLLLALVSWVSTPPAWAQDPKPTTAPAPAKVAAATEQARDLVMVPGGPFSMGCNATVDTECDDRDGVGRTVEVDAFSIDRTEVTVAAYARCRAAEQCSSSGLTMPFFDDQDQPEFAEFCNWQKPGREHHPINCVNWDQAVAFCKWAGKRLPSEAEWEKAARGTDGRKYPWGSDGYGSGKKLANIADETAKRRFPEWTIAAGYDDGVAGTAAVGSYPAGASPAGALDMIGNVFEWTADTVAHGRTVRGGAWDTGPSGARASTRSWVGAANRNANVGFRCAR